MDEQQLFLLAAPVAVIDICGKVAALMSLYKAEQVRFGNKILWVAVILMLSIFGWIVWFLAGREE